jgi:hypothetical protein
VAIEEVAHEQKIEIRGDVGKFDVESEYNDWGKHPTGEAFRDSLTHRGRVSLAERVASDDKLRVLARELPGTEGGGAGPEGRTELGSAGTGAGSERPVEQSPVCYEQATPPAGSEGPRGAYEPATGTHVLLENANLTTFVHDFGHHGLEVFADLAAQNDALALARARIPPQRTQYAWR